MNAGQPTAQQLQTWFSQTDTIVSGPGGRVELSESQRRLALLFSNGTLLVDAEHPGHPQILALREVARRKGIPIRATYPVAIELMRQLYGEVNKRQPEASDNSLPMQQAWIALLQEGVSVSASDVHIYVHAHEADIKFRVRGEMRPVRQISAVYGHELLACAYNMAEAADATYRLYDYQAGRISSFSAPLPAGLQSVRLQINPMGSGGRYLIARLLYAQSRWDLPPTLESLGLMPQQLHCLARMRLVPEGVNIISGPTGSGKSTTLKIVLEQLYRERKQMINILTIEDPPEYEIHGAAQLPVSNVDGEEERGAAYRKAIVAALRSDPDVIMPGEARDREVINLVFTAAMTGHQVWTSLHANSAIGIFDRLLDQGVESYKLTDPSLLTGLTAQRLAKQLCPECSVPVSAAEFASIEQSLSGFAAVAHDHRSTLRLAHAPGCAQCSMGYSGRMALMEAICPDQDFLNLIKNGERQLAQQHWLDSLEGITMMEHGWLQMVAGKLDPRDLVDRLGPFKGLSATRRATLLTMAAEH